MTHFTLAATFATIAVALSLSAQAVEFPDVDALPSRPNLPDPLVKFDGSATTSKRDWTETRRPELKALFEHYMYGKAPAAPERVTATLDREDGNALGGKATLREVSLAFGPPETPRIHLLLIVPNHGGKPAPVFVGLSFAGNHTVLDDPGIALSKAPGPESKSKKYSPPARGAQVGIWNAEAIVDRGYALAVFYSGDVAPDRPGRNQGVFPHYPGYDWGNIAAWAWGASRVADYLVTVRDVDRAKMMVIGHSRMGKAALLAGAFDDRFAVVFAHQAGCGGSAPSRGTVGSKVFESVTRINTSFPHWFNDEFKKFNDQPDKLPFDQNCLAAMVAPRALLFTCAVEDKWSNPEGQFRVLKAAEPVYRLLDAGGLEASQMPEPNKLIDSTLGYAIRPGKHSMNREDWTFFLDYADKQLGKAGR